MSCIGFAGGLLGLVILGVAIAGVAAVVAVIVGDVVGDEMGDVKGADTFALFACEKNQ